MTYHMKRLDAAITKLAAAYTPDERKMLGFPEPAPLAGLQQGEVLERWIDRQDTFDRILWRAVWVVVILGGIASLGAVLLGWMP
jgi:hypothetical protein